MSDRKLHPGQIQNWQVVAILQNGREMLVTLGTSCDEVKRRYWDSLSYLAGHGVVEVMLRRWDGDQFGGRWIYAGKLDAGDIIKEVTAA